MRVLFAGTPAPAVPALEALVSSGHDVVAVLTRPDRRAGRGRTLTRSEVGVRADELGLPLLQPPTVRDAEFHARLRELELDVAAIVAYGGLIPPDALRIPRRGWVNLHFSLLPRWRGAAPVQHAIAAGDQVTGISTFELEEGLDTGPIYRQVSMDICDTDTSGVLLDRLAHLGAEQLRGTIDDIDAGAQPTPQPTDDVRFAPKVEVDDVRVDFTATAAEIDRLIRSATPAPGAWTMLGDQRLKLGPVTVTDEQLPAGTLEVRKREVLVGTADRAVRLGDVQPPGKKAMPAADAARGARWASGDLVGAR